MKPSPAPLKDSIRSIYLAGRIKPLDWRHTPVQGLRDDAWTWKAGSTFPVLDKVIYGRFDYLGPFYPLIDSASDHGAVPGGYLGAYAGGKLTEKHYKNYCLEAIRRADLVAGYFEEWPDDGKHDDWLTASQLVYALSLGKKILSITPSPFEELCVESVFAADTFPRSWAPRISLGRQLGLTDSEIDTSAGAGYVYFLESVTGQIKIGHSADPDYRKGQLQTGSPTKHTLLGAIPGSKTLERKLHRDFDEYHVRDEWFHGVKRLRDFIASIVLPAPGEVEPQS